MEKTNFVTKLISALLFVAIAIYIGVSAINYYTNPYSTTTAISVTTGDTLAAEGFIVREESLLETDAPYIRVTADEGAKIGAGQAIAVSYASESAREASARIETLALEIEQLTAFVSATSGSEEAMTMETSVKNSILDMNYNLSQGDLSGLSETSVILRTLIFSANAEDAQSRLDSLQAELRTLKDTSDADGTAILAETPGIFSSNVDGFEAVTPSRIAEMTAGEAKALIAAGTSESSALGKLITGTDWFFVAVLSESDAARIEELTANGTATVAATVTGAYTGAIEMTVERVGAAEDGSVPVILSCNRYLADTLWSRVTDITLTLDEKTGIRVPKEALHTDEEGQTFIYTEKALQVEVRYVDIVTEYGNYYLVESAEGETVTLRAGEEIIVTGKNLYDGKVIEK